MEPDNLEIKSLSYSWCLTKAPRLLCRKLKLFFKMVLDYHMGGKNEPLPRSHTTQKIIWECQQDGRLRSRLAQAPLGGEGWGRITGEIARRGSCASTSQSPQRQHQPRPPGSTRSSRLSQNQGDPHLQQPWQDGDLQVLPALQWRYTTATYLGDSSFGI